MYKRFHPEHVKTLYQPLMGSAVFSGGAGGSMLLLNHSVAHRTKTSIDTLSKVEFVDSTGYCVATRSSVALPDQKPRLNYTGDLALHSTDGTSKVPLDRYAFAFSTAHEVETITNQRELMGRPNAGFIASTLYAPTRGTEWF